VTQARRAELAARLETVRRRVDEACRAAGRDPGDVTVIVVTKTWPADDVRLLAGLGVRDVGENRDKEAAGKRAACAGLPLRWHFVGQVQTNKAAAVAASADVVHSVDRHRLVAALDRGAQRAGRRVDALVQVRLDDDEGRGGAAPDEALEVAAAVDRSEHLRLRGVMAVAPLGRDPAEAFARLGDVARGVRGRHPEATWVSAGMSSDLEAAVHAGATHLRVGTAILGSRPPLR
jgi:pyridoxal phosphate enzyme (YggS family)